MLYRIDLYPPGRPELDSYYSVGLLYDHEMLGSYDDPNYVDYVYWKFPRRRAYLFTEEELDSQRLKDYLDSIKDKFQHRIVQVKEEEGTAGVLNIAKLDNTF